MEMLPTEFRFPEQKPGQGLQEYVHELRQHVEASWNQMRKRLNWLLERVHVTQEADGVLDRNGERYMVIEFIQPGRTKNDDGNFRLRIVKNAATEDNQDPDTWVYDLILEVRISSVWTDVKVFYG